MATQGLKYVFSADVTNFVAGTRRVQDQFKETAKQARSSTKAISDTAVASNGAAGALKTLGKATVAFVGARALARFATQAMDAGGQMEKLRRISLNTFQDSGDAAIAWASEVAGAYNITNREALGFVNSSGLMLTGMGFIERDAAAMSVELGKLAGNLAFINDMEADDAFQTVESAVMGVTRGIKRLGYDLSQANLQQYMYNQGLKEQFRDLSTTNQAVVRYNYLIQQTAGTQNVAKNSAMGWTATLLAIRRAWDELKVSIGELLTTVLLPLARMLNTIIGLLVRATQAMVAFIRVIFGIKAPAKMAASAVNDIPLGVGGSADDATGSLKKMRKEIQKLMGFDELNILADDPDQSAGGGVDLGGLGDGLIMPIDYSELNLATEAAEKLRKKWEEVAKQFIKYENPIKIALAGVAGAIAGAFVARNWGSIVAGMAGAFGAIKSGFAGLGGIIALPLQYVGLFIASVKELGLVNTILTFASAAWEAIAVAMSAPIAAAAAVVLIFAAIAAAVYELWITNDEFKESVINAWNGIKEVLNTAWEVVFKPILKSLQEALLFVWEHGVKPLWDAWVEFVRVAIDGMIRVWNAMSPFYIWLVETFGPIAAVAVDMLAKAFAIAFAAVGQTLNLALKVATGVVDSLFSVFEGIIDFVLGAFSGDWGKAWDGVVKVFAATIGKVYGIFKGVWDKVIDLFSHGGSVFKGLTEGIVSIFKSIVNGLISGINQIIAIPFRQLNSLLSNIQETSVLGFKPFGWMSARLPVPQIPRFAEGGILSGPTIGLMGEYEGARTDPEVVSPLSKLKGMLDTGSSKEEMALLKQQNELLTQILNKDSNTYLDSRKVNEATSRRQRRVAISKGVA